MVSPYSGLFTVLGSSCIFPAMTFKATSDANGWFKIETERLRLRAFSQGDAPAVQRLAGDARVAATTAMMPHPYLNGMAEGWISTHKAQFRDGRGVTFAIDLLPRAGAETEGAKQTDAEPRVAAGELIGCIDLVISKPHRKAEMGYWIGVPYWNRGYGTEAARALIRFAFENLGLNKITSRHLSTNPASGKVMSRCGMRKEGHLRDEFMKNGILLDVEVYGLLRSEWPAAAQTEAGKSALGPETRDMLGPQHETSKVK